MFGINPRVVNFAKQTNEVMEISSELLDKALIFYRRLCNKYDPDAVKLINKFLSACDTGYSTEELHLFFSTYLEIKAHEKDIDYDFFHQYNSSTPKKNHRLDIKSKRQIQEIANDGLQSNEKDDALIQISTLEEQINKINLKVKLLAKRL